MRGWTGGRVYGDKGAGDGARGGGDGEEGRGIGEEGTWVGKFLGAGVIPNFIVF